MVLARVQADLIAEPLGTAPLGTPACASLEGGCQTEQLMRNGTAASA